MILVTAATPWESRPLAKALGLTAAGPRLYRGVLAGRAVWLLETGMGAAPAAAALAGLKDPNGDGPLELVVSSGLAGALQPGIASGELVCDPHGGPVALARAARAAAESFGIPLHMGTALCAERVLGPEEKRRLGDRRRALAVDMESAAVRAWCEKRGTAFAVLRAVLDPVDERLPAGVPDGPGLWPALRFAAAHAGELPLLARLGWRQRRALRRLASVLRAVLEADLGEESPQ